MKTSIYTITVQPQSMLQRLLTATMSVDANIKQSFMNKRNSSERKKGNWISSQRNEVEEQKDPNDPSDKKTKAGRFIQRFNEERMTTARLENNRCRTFQQIS